MITPNFQVAQDAKYIHLTIKAPMAKINETSVAFDGQMFCFHSKPYYLRLNLPGKLSPQDGSEKIDWSAEKNEFLVSVLKETEGEIFDDLDMLTKLLTKPKKERDQLSPAIEVIDPVLDEDQEDYDWYIEQNEWTEEQEKAILGEKYGFANRYSGILDRFIDEIGDLMELKKPETTTNSERKELRMAKDRELFSEDHYWYDLHEQKETILELISFTFDWEPAKAPSDSYVFNDEEIFKLKNLPKREYILSKKEKFQLLLGLVDILFAYAYDMRTTEGEHSCESGWTIIKLSSTLSWLQVYSTLPETLVACIQRSLVYPLYRNWALSLKVIDDVLNMISRGRSYVIKCLLDVHRIFNESGDLQYIFNDLFITDYCVWLQNVREKTFASLADAMKKVEIDKEMIGFDLNTVEKAGEIALSECK